MADLQSRLAGLSPEKRALLARRLREGATAAPVRAAEPLAVVGIGCRLPGGARDADALWNMLLDGVDAVSEVSPERWVADDLYDVDPLASGRTNTRWGALLDFTRELEGFDERFFGITPREAERMDPQQRLLLETAWEALEHAGLPPDRLAGQPVGVFVGIHSLSADYFWQQARNLDDIDVYTSTGVAHSIVANRLSYLLDLRGPSLAVDTACSSSLVAVHLAGQSLRQRECDVALAGGVNLILTPEVTVAFSKLQMMARDGRCKTFDARADGFVRGEGCGVIALKRLSDAQRDGDRVLALIRGSAVNQDGATNGLTAPNGLAQQAVIRDALTNGGVAPGSVSYVETHGTGTALGDPIEVEAIASVLESGASQLPCVLGALKTNIGHLEAAAGIAGLIKVVLCLQHGRIPKNLHLQAINPHVRLEGTRLELPSENRPWTVPEGVSRIAGVSSFGFGGTNAHIVLEEAPASEVRTAERSAGPRILPLSARTGESLHSLADTWTTFLLRPDTLATPLGDIVYSASSRRTHHPLRRAVVGDTHQALAEALADARPLPTSSPVSPGGLVFVYSGQGPQWSGMGQQLYEAEPVFRDAIDRCEAEFARHASWSLLNELRAPEENSRLRNTDIAQPALFAIQVALTELFRAWGVAFEAVVGHSIGEVAAAWASGALTFEDAARLVVLRGRLMQAAHGKGRMLAVEQPADAVAARLRGETGLTLAAMNSPTSSVVAGDREAVAAFEARLVAEGVRCKIVNTEYAFHSTHVETSAAQFAAELVGLKAAVPSLTWVSTVSGRQMDAACTPAYWRQNMREPVRFADAIATLLADDRRTFVEIGPHPVLTSMIAVCAATAAAAPVEVVPTLRRGQAEQHAALTAVARVYELGFDVNWNAQGTGRSVALPTYPWDRHPHWIDRVRARRGNRQDAPADDADLYYEIEWQPKAHVASSVPRRTPEYLAAPEVIAQRLGPWRRRFEETPAATGPELEHIWRLFGIGALRTLGQSSGDRIDRATLERVAAPARTELLARVVRDLESSGWVTADPDGWRDAGPGDDPAVLLEKLIAADSTSAPVARLIGICGPKLAELLRGSLDSAALLASPDVAAAVDRVLDESLFSRSGNALLAQAVATSIENLPSDRVVRILEIGGGARAAAEELLTLLPEGRSEYVYTAASLELLESTRRRIGARPFVRFAPLDIERDPAGQGFGNGQFDIIVTSHALDARVVPAALQSICQLLTPGGLLVALEPASRRAWFDATVRLRDDRTAAGRNPQALSSNEWREALIACGLNGEAVEVSSAPQHSLLPQRLVVARADSQPVGVGSLSSERRDQDDTAVTWCVFADTTGVAEALEQRLASRRGTRVVMVSRANAFNASGDRVQIRPEESANFDALLAALPDDGRQLRVVNLWALDVDDDASVAAQWSDVESAVCGPALNLVSALRRSGRPTCEIWLVTRGVQAGAAADISLSQSPLWGVGRVLALEHPEYWGGLIDLDGTRNSDANATLLLQELDASDGEDQIAYRNGDRFVPRLVPTQVRASTRLQLRRDRAYFITGGVGGLGLQLARWMVTAGAGWLVLGSRRGVAGLDQDAQAGLRNLERLGAVVEVVPVDVAEISSLRAVFDSFGRERPRLAGVVHAAGVIEMHSIESMPPDALRRVLRPKVAGAWNLHTLSASHPLDFFVLFSSAASVWGSAGMAHYSAANHFLDTLASYRQRAGLPVTCFNWGWWEGGASTEAHHQYYAQIGLKSLHSPQALAAFETVIASGRPATTVARVDWARFAAVYQARRSRPLLEHVADLGLQAADTGERGERTTRFVDSLRQMPADHVMTQLAAHIRAEVAGVIGLASADRVQDTDGFFDLGMDSITTVELRSRLQHAFGCALPVTVAFEYPTVVALAGFIARELGLVSAQSVSQSSPVARAPQTTIDDFSKQSLDELAELLDDSIAEVMGVDGGKEHR
jgi:microcystin synthetase protein McyG